MTVWDFNDKIQTYINSIEDKDLKEELQKILDMPGCTYEDFNYKVFLFNDGYLRSEEEIEKYNNLKRKTDYLFKDGKYTMVSSEPVECPKELKYVAVWATFFIYLFLISETCMVGIFLIVPSLILCVAILGCWDKVDMSNYDEKSYDYKN